MARLILVCALIFVSILIQKCDATPLDVYVLAGQSNAWGHGRWSQVSAPDRALPAQVPYYRPYRDGGFGFVRPIEGSFGPEIRFGVDMQHRSDKPFAVVKHAIGGTTLAMNWRARDGELYQEMTDAVDVAISEWSAQGYEPRVVGMLWMQGEYDALNASFAAAYAENLTDFIDAVREDFDSPAMPFVLGRIAVPTFEYRDVVRAAQEEVSDTIAGVTMIDTDQVPMKEDQVHFDSQGQLQLGSMFAAAMPDLLAGDIDRDWDVDLDDLNTVRNQFGASGAFGVAGDVYPYDGVVGLDDLNAVRNNFGAGMATTVVPEPASIALLGFGAIAIAAGRRASERKT